MESQRQTIIMQFLETQEKENIKKNSNQLKKIFLIKIKVVKKSNYDFKPL